MRMSLLLAASAAVLIAACSNEASAPAPVAAQPTKAVLGEWGVDLTNRDEAVKVASHLPLA